VGRERREHGEARPAFLGGRREGRAAAEGKRAPVESGRIRRVRGI
jgi:hypothetical protein